MAAQAREYGHAKRRELSYLVVHSVLHLLGYDHLDEGPQKARMRAREEADPGGAGHRAVNHSLGQAPAGAQARQESVDGGELQVFFIAFQGVITQLVMNHIHVEVIVVRWDSVQGGLDVVEIKPYHKV